MKKTDTEIRWTAEGTIYKDDKEPLFKYPADRIIVTRNLHEESVFVIHYQNSSNHPRGATVSHKGSDIFHWDPDDFGFPHLAGTYQMRDRQMLFLVNRQIVSLANEKNSMSLFSFHTVDLSSSGCQRLATIGKVGYTNFSPNRRQCNPYLATMSDIRNLPVVANILHG